MVVSQGHWGGGCSLFSFKMRDSRIHLHGEEESAERKGRKPQERWVIIDGAILGEMRGN